MHFKLALLFFILDPQLFLLSSLILGFLYRSHLAHHVFREFSLHTCASSGGPSTRLGFLTMIGPDAGIVSCEVDGGRWRCRTNLLDRWAYFFRLSVVPLIDDLPPGQHTAILRFEEEKPDRSVLKKAPSGPHWAAFQREGKAHKLWLMHWLIEEESALERAVVRSATAPSGYNGSAQLPLPNARLGGAGMAAGGRRADAYG